MPSQKRQRKKQGRQARQEELRAEQQRSRRRKRGVLGIGVVVLIAVMAALFSQEDSSKAKKVAAGNSTTTSGATASSTTAAGKDEKRSSSACPAADGSAEKKIQFDGVPPMCIDAAKSYEASVETDVGVFTVALDVKKAPKTVNNFVFLARYHFYDGVPFHRVIPGFVVQGGDAEKGDGTGGPGYEFADELPKQGDYEIGSVAMANSGPNTNGSQFFVVTGPQGAGLPPNYSLFGKVVEGLDVVKKIEADGSEEGKPKVVHKMTKVTVTEK